MSVMDGWTDAWSGGGRGVGCHRLMNDKRVDSLIKRFCRDEQICQWDDRKKNQSNGWTNDWTFKISEMTDGWIDEWMDGWMDELANGSNTFVSQQTFT